MPSQLIKKWGHWYIDFTNDFKKSIALVIRKLVTYLQQLNTMMKINYIRHFINSTFPQSL